MAILEKVAFVIKPDQMWNWRNMLSQNFLIAHINPSSIDESYNAEYTYSRTPGSPLAQDFYLGGSAHTISFTLEFDDTALLIDNGLLANGQTFRRMNTYDSIRWLQTIQLPEVNGYNAVGLELEPPIILFIWGSRPIYEWRLTIGTIKQKRFDKNTKLPITASVPITLTRSFGSFIQE